MNIKKILFSLLFIAVFGIYVIYQKSNSSTNNIINSNPISDNKNSVSNLSANSQNQNVAQNTKPKPSQNTGFKNGTYTGNSVDAFYGMVQVQAVISGGKITDIRFLDYPQDRQNSLELSNYALPQLKSEAIQAQSSNVNAISGATATSDAFVQSLSSALSKAS